MLPLNIGKGLLLKYNKVYSYMPYGTRAIHRTVSQNVNISLIINNLTNISHFDVRCLFNNCLTIEIDLIRTFSRSCGIPKEAPI